MRRKRNPTIQEKEMNPEDEEVIDNVDETVEDEDLEDRGDDFVPDGEDELEEELTEEEEDGDSDGEDGDESGYEVEDSEDAEDLAAAGEGSSNQGQGSDNQIPQGRFNEVIQQREWEREQNEALRKQNEQLLTLLKQGQEPETTDTAYDYDAAEESHMEAVLEGDTAKAKAIRAEIRAAERAEFLKEAAAYKDEALKGAATEAARIDDETKLNTIITRSTEEYEFLDPKSKSYDQTAVNDINDIFEGFVASGKSKAVALQRAIDLITPKYKASVERGLGESKKSDRRKTAIKKNVSASKKQPPRMRGKTTRDKTVNEYDVEHMSERAFKKLSKAELAELRGDKV